MRLNILPLVGFPARSSPRTQRFSKPQRFQYLSSSGFLHLRKSSIQYEANRFVASPEMESQMHDSLTCRRFLTSFVATLKRKIRKLGILTKHHVKREQSDKARCGDSSTVQLGRKWRVGNHAISRFSHSLAINHIETG